MLDEEAPERPAPKAPKPKEPEAKVSTDPVGGKTAEDEDKARPQPRYDSKSFSKWIENNPDKAADLAAKVFKTQLGGNSEQWKKHFIAAENKRRRQSEQDEGVQSAIAKDKAEVERLAKEAREPLEPILDLIEAEQKEDFPAIDRFIETAFGTTFDDYCRRRLRGLGKETVTERALKQKVAALEAKIGKDTAPVEVREEAPKVSEKWLEKEIPGDHGVRDLADWKKKVTAAYEKSQDADTGDYDLSIEEAAQSVLDEFLSKRAPKESKDPPRRRATPPPRRTKAWTDDDEDGGERTPSKDLDDAAPTNLDYAARTRIALANAAKRAAR